MTDKRDDARGRDCRARSSLLVVEEERRGLTQDWVLRQGEIEEMD